MSTSLKNRKESYLAIIDKLPEKRKLIYELIKENPSCSLWDISVKYMIPINEVSGRFTDLKKLCLIVEDGSRENRHSNRNNTLYRVVRDEKERNDLINERLSNLREKREKITKDFSLGLSDFSLKTIRKEFKKIKNQITSLEKLVVE